MIPYLRPTPNWGRIKFSDSFIYEMKYWNQSIRRNFKTGDITILHYDNSGTLTSITRKITREAAIKVIKSYVLWMNRINEYKEFKFTSKQ